MNYNQGTHKATPGAACDSRTGGLDNGTFREARMSDAHRTNGVNPAHAWQFREGGLRLVATTGTIVIDDPLAVWDILRLERIDRPFDLAWLDPIVDKHQRSHAGLVGLLDQFGFDLADWGQTIELDGWLQEKRTDAWRHIWNALSAGCTTDTAWLFSEGSLLWSENLAPGQATHTPTNWFGNVPNGMP